ncbi:hypothetical protein AB1L88_18890 [Tautonia sp. JC769]|uniref:hypothetical protein n=1 Tax=Tautonia sp. JC769 TaxID=3232135 RepID=UPI00345939FE
MIGSRMAGVVGPALLCALMLGWLWPIGLGGAMPVGGDVTQFQMGLMSVLGEAIRAGRLPFWNDRWGFGFPGLAESQMGVYYPPHWLCFGLLPVEAGYTASMVLHLLWGAIGAYWAARRFGVSSRGATLAGGAWGASGFFLIHLPHLWAFCVGSWTPWIWGLAWSILSGRGGRGTPWLLAAALTVQILPGHFQLAFCTQVSLGVMALGAIVRGRGERRAVARRSAVVLLVLLAVLPMAACQLLPTARLARLAETQRDFEYLSGFAATPLHLVNLVAPDLFHRSPLWRPVVWDPPFHTSPEELRLYVGLVPAFLALMVLVKPGSHAGAIRVLGLVLAVGLFLSLGPYVPGFRIFSQWPGFSFFRAPARWGMIVSLALAILAGFGLDAIREGRLVHPGRWLVGCVLGAVLWIGVVVGLFELGLNATERPGPSVVVALYERVFAQFPWPNDPPVTEVFARARRPQADVRVIAAQGREKLGPVPTGGLRLDRERGRIYRAELGTTAALLLAVVLLVPLANRRRTLVAGLLLLTAVDLGLMARRRSVDAAPIRPLTEQSLVLSRLAELPQGTRSIDPMRNLTMVAGAAGVLSYRTLDLPIQAELRGLADAIPRSPEEADAILDAQRSLGARVRVIGPIGPGIEVLRDRFTETGRIESAAILDDPALTAWLLGSGYAATDEGKGGRYLFLDAGPAPRAWFLPTDGPEAIGRFRKESTDAASILGQLEDARPIELRMRSPEHLELSVAAEGPGLVLVTQLDYPEWAASLIDAEGAANPVPVDGVLGGWQGVAVPGPGSWTIRLTYEGRAERWGLVVSSAAWAAWLVGVAVTLRRSRQRLRIDPTA